MRIKIVLAAVLVLTSLTLFTKTCLAKEEPYRITIKDHVFIPAELVVPANKKIKLTVKNEDPTPEEFESYDLNREKIVTGNGTITLFIGPLKAGVYKYFGEFHQDTAQGIIKAEDITIRKEQ